MAACRLPAVYHPSARCSLPLSSWDPCLTKENRGSQGHSPGGRKREEGNAVLTVRQAVSPEAIQAEILQHSGQLTATVDLGLAGGEQEAEQRRQGQRRHPRQARPPPGSPAPTFHAGGRAGDPAALATSWALTGSSQKGTPGRRRETGPECTWEVPTCSPAALMGPQPYHQEPEEGSPRPASFPSNPAL